MSARLKKITAFWRSKTLSFGWALVALGALYDNFSVIKPLIPEGYQGSAYALIGIVVIVLRAFTDKSLSEK